MIRRPPVIFSQNRGYKFSYDALNRLTEAVYGANNFGTHHNRYNEKVVEYSANGMMKRFQRRGLKSNGIYGKVDNLHITLDGNRPVKIIEDAGNQTVYGAMEFHSHSAAETQYGYDGNGSLVWDANKQIAHITYDNLNYPMEVQFTNGNRVQYVYSPDGEKLRATWQTAKGTIVVPLNSTVPLNGRQISSTTRTDYVGGIIYTGTSSSSSTSVSLEKCLFEGGYATVTSSTQPVFHYYTQDHLGNNRAVVNQSGAVEQITHYYPFGGIFADQGTGSSLQPYKYNGKELDRMHGLDLYDYGARQYDAVVPMFTQQDPMAEKYYHLSPYAYSGNNPVNAIDVDGRSILKIGGKVLYRIGKAVAKSGLSALYKAETYYSAFNDIEDDIKTITDENTTTTEKVKATASLASELGPLSIKDIRSVSNAAKEALSKGQKILGREGKVIVKKNGITIKSYGTNDAHKPAHAHVKGKGHEVRIGPNGKPLKGEKELSTQQKQIVDENKKEIRREINKVGKENKKIEEYE